MKSPFRQMNKMMSGPAENAGFFCGRQEMGNSYKGRKKRTIFPYLLIVMDKEFRR